MQTITIILLAALCCVAISKQIKFCASHRVAKVLQPGVEASFSTWFRRPETVEIILKANPGIVSTEKLNDDMYEGKLSPLQFPGLKVIPTIRFLTKFDGRGLEVSCSQDSLQQEFEGSKLFASWLSKLFPQVTSCNKCNYDETINELSNEASLEIKFNLPAWFPIPAQIIDEKGSAVIQQGLDKDLTILIDNVIKEYDQQQVIVPEG